MGSLWLSVPRTTRNSRSNTWRIPVRLRCGSVQLCRSSLDTHTPLLYRCTVGCICRVASPTTVNRCCMWRQAAARPIAAANLALSEFDRVTVPVVSTSDWRWTLCTEWLDGWAWHDDGRSKFIHFWFAVDHSSRVCNAFQHSELVFTCACSFAIMSV